MKALKVHTGRITTDGQFIIKSIRIENDVRDTGVQVDDYNTVMQILRLHNRPLAPENSFFSYTFGFSLGN